MTGKTTNRWYVYILRCVDQSLYTGITTDVKRRLHEHNHSNRLAAKYTRGKRPVSLVYCEIQATRGLAAKREAQIKRLAKPEKLQLLQSNKAKGSSAVL